MIHHDLTFEQDAALYTVAEKTLQASRLAMNAMKGQPIDPAQANTLMFEGIAALRSAFPDEIDAHAIWTAMSTTCLLPGCESDVPHLSGATGSATGPAFEEHDDQLVELTDMAAGQEGW